MKARASAKTTTAIHTADEFKLSVEISLAAKEGFDDDVLAASEVVVPLADFDEAEVPEKSGTPPTPVELRQESVPRMVAWELKVISAH